MSSTNPIRTTARLSKSRFTAGLQCEKLLWWRVHEPDAPELVADPSMQLIFDRGHAVGELAQTYYPGGVLIDLPHYEVDARLEATRKAIEEGAPAIFEATFFEDGVFVAVDILKRERGGYALIEVKSTLGVKEQHLPDVAIQVHVARKAGLKIVRAELMHLNRDCRFPDLSNLFVNEDVTKQIKPWLQEAPAKIREFRESIAGELPEVSIGPHCNEPYECPFKARCWPKLPGHHVSTLYKISAKKLTELETDGITLVRDVPEDFPSSEPARRQIRSVRSRRVIVEAGLKPALEQLKGPLAFLDFETVAPAIPSWPGCGPYQQIPVQFSCHVSTDEGLVHHDWIADGPGDPRDAFAKALLKACKGAKTILAYNAPFEVGRIEALAIALPERAAGLRKLVTRIRDLLPIVRDNVYHPDFGGSFSIKKVLPALVKRLSYDNLEIADGSTASAVLETLLFNAGEVTTRQRATLSRQLRAYCKLDTLAMVRLVQQLEKLAKAKVR